MTTEHVRYWLDTAAHDWNAVDTLQIRTPRPALVFAHWTLEKLSKALWVQEHSGLMPPASDDIAKLLAATSIILTPTQMELVGRVKAFHDDVVESDPNKLKPQFREHETPQSLIAQVDALRQQLLANLAKKIA